MKKVYLFLVPFLAVSAFADPVVSNIRASQRENTKLVDILYDVSYVGGSNISVICEVSTNGGASYDIPAESFSGDGYGAIVATGTDRLITWNAGVDWDENYSEQMKVRITAKARRFTVNVFLVTNVLVDVNGSVTTSLEVDRQILDNETGLIWDTGQKQIEVYLGDGIFTSGFAAPYNDVVNYISTYSGGWRLPTKEEFAGLLDCSHTPALPDPFGNSPSGVFWSSSLSVRETESEVFPHAWCISLITGFEIELPLTSSAGIWLVKSVY